MSFLRKMFSGQVKTDDTRRFLIEAMLGAMEADGDVTEDEMATFQSSLENHDLFKGLTGEEIERFIDLAAASIRDGGGGKARLPDIAKNLPSRSQRLAAYAMAGGATHLPAGRRNGRSRKSTWPRPGPAATPGSASIVAAARSCPNIPIAA